jgi:hypothetical protein
MRKLKYVQLFENFTEEEPKTNAQLIASDEISAPKGYKPSQNVDKKGIYNVKDGIVAWIDKTDGYYRSENTKQRGREHQANSEADLLSSLKRGGYELQPMLPCEIDTKTKVGYGSERVAN